MGLKVPPAFKFRNFVLMWLGLMISNAGSQMQLWALFWHIRQLSPDPIAVSGVGVARFVPILILSLFAGVVADRFNRRTVMLITQSVMIAVALALAWLTWSGQITLWHIYALTAIQAVAMAFDSPARQSLVPNLVPKDVLPSAFSLQSLSFNIGSIIGPALSGWVIAAASQETTYLINAISFLAVIGALLAIGQVAAQPVIPDEAQVRSSGNLGAIRDGLRFIGSQPLILSTMILDFFATFFASANTLLPYIAQDVLHVGVVEYGWLSAAQSIGSVSVGLVLSQRENIRNQGPVVLGAVVVFGLATILFGVSTSFILTMLALIVIGGADTVSTIIRNTLRQLQTPDHLRGRMVSVNQIFFMGGPQLGEIEAGLAAQLAGVPGAVVIGGVGCIAAAAVVGLQWPVLRGYSGEKAEEPA